VVPADGTAEVLTDPATVDRLQGEIRSKYGLQYYLVTLIEKIAAGDETSRGSSCG